MKKIYSKFTIERKPQFQLETSIIVDHGQKNVVKTPLCEASEKHIAKMYSNYKKYSNNSSFQLAKCSMNGKNVVFDFVEGKSFCSILLECVVRKDKPKFVEELLDYRKLAEENLNNDFMGFSTSAEFEQVFGSYEKLNGLNAGKNLNIDFTFDNIVISDNGVKTIIDYEWYFDFLIPINFVMYRAIHGFCVKYGQMIHGFTSENEICSIFGISENEINTYLQMDMQFVAYVYGKEDGYNTILEAYRKESVEVKDMFYQNADQAQLFINTGDGFNADDVLNYPIEATKKEQNITFQISRFQNIKEVRFDPIDGACTIDLCRVIAKLKNGEKIELEVQNSNAEFKEDRIYLFRTEDPQFIINIGDKEIQEITITFQVIEKGISKVVDLCLSVKEASEKAYDEKMMSSLDTIEELNKKIVLLEREKNVLLVNKQGLEQRLNVLANDYHLLQFEQKNR